MIKILSFNFSYAIALSLFLLLCENNYAQSIPKGRDADLVQKKIVPSMATWNADTAKINLAATYTPFTVFGNLRSIKSSQDVMDDEVHDEIKEITAYGNSKGILHVADLDVRLAIPTFEARYPDELQQMLVVREIEIKGDDTVNVSFLSRSLNDHYQKPYGKRSGSFVKAYKYNLSADGLINPGSLKEITDGCIVTSATSDSVHLKLPNRLLRSSTHIFLIVSFTYAYPDVFSPHLKEYESDIVRKYARAGLAGAMKDEWGFPNAISEQSVKTEYWYSVFREKAYQQITDGRNLMNDILLMHRGIDGQEAERIQAINHFQEMARTRNVELENSFYHTVKEVFGPDGIVLAHPTWFPYPERREYKKNGLDWWEVKRDWAQTDEVVPFGIRTSLAKKWNSPVWYTMYYRYGVPQGSEGADDYEEELWSSALAGGRVTNLAHIGVENVVASNYVRAETRIRLLNYIDPVPLNCPVAVVFGHASAMNWAGPSFEQTGMNLIDSFWRMGIAADLIPTSEIWNNSLTIDKDGYVCYGKQRYSAVILYNPEFEKPTTTTFFNQAAKGKTRLFRVGNWTKDFNGNLYNGNSLLPRSMQFETTIESVLSEVPRLLDAKNIPRQSPATRFVEGFGHLSYATPTTGFSYLLDGTLVQTAATGSGAGDTLRTTMKIDKYDVAVDAIGMAAVRLDKKGNLEALAASGLKSVEAGNFKLLLDQRTDLALWKNDKGKWEGLIQGWQGEIPSALLKITSKWARLELPEPYPRRQEPRVKKIHLAEGLNSSGSGPLLKDIDGNTYHTLKAGNQIWMAENLRVSRYNDGSPIESPGENLIDWFGNRSGAYAWYQNDSAKYESAYGKIYNYHAVETGKLCPSGWRVPNDNDWKTLLTYMFEESDKPSNAASGFKGFNPLAAGYRDQYGAYYALGRYGLWWSSSGTLNRMVWNREPKQIYMIGDKPQTVGQAICVRCILDQPK